MNPMTRRDVVMAFAATAATALMPAAFAQDSGEYRILQARYGTPERNVDVTQRLRELVRSDQTSAHYGDEVTLDAVAATVPLGRMATPDDVADACLLLASPLAGYISGANLVVDGGGQRPAFADAIQRARP